MSRFIGAQPMVSVQTPRQSELERKAKELLLGRTINGVFLSQGQLTLKLDDGGSFTMSCEGGFLEAS